MIADFNLMGHSIAVSVVFTGSTAPLMVNNIKFIFVGWVERSETQHFRAFVGFRSSTQPTINVVLHKGNGRAFLL